LTGEQAEERLQPQICDYEGSTYRTDFWEGQGREYEDLAERIALRKLLSPDGDLLMEVGSGFGRLADLYGGYNKVVLLDYSKSMLRQAPAGISTRRSLHSRICQQTPPQSYSALRAAPPAVESLCPGTC